MPSNCCSSRQHEPLSIALVQAPSVQQRTEVHSGSARTSTHLAALSGLQGQELLVGASLVVGQCTGQVLQRGTVSHLHASPGFRPMQAGKRPRQQVSLQLQCYPLSLGTPPVPKVLHCLHDSSCSC